jgi:hypothetical protein
VHDLVRLEQRGVPSVGVATEPFADEAVEQAAVLGMPDCRMVYLPHPVQLLTTAELHGLADAVFAQVVVALRAPGAPPGGDQRAVLRPPAGGTKPRSA